MQKIFENIKKKVIISATEACAYRENTRVISEAELKEILEEEFANFVPDINVGDNGWIPCSEMLPENNDNVRVTVEKNGDLEVAVGWYNHDKRKWKVCPSDDDEFHYYGYGVVIAWKENTEEPYQPGSAEKPRTNADRIRAMTDEELADAIIKNSFNTFAEVITFCKNDEKCSDILEDSCDGMPEHMCRECLLEWLKKPEGDVSD